MENCPGQSTQTKNQLRLWAWVLETARYIMLKKLTTFCQANMQNIRKRQNHEYKKYEKEIALAKLSCPFLQSASTRQVLSVAGSSIYREVF